MPDETAVALIATLLVPTTIGVVAALTTAGVPTRFAPLVALVIGIAMGVGLFLTGRITDGLVAVVTGAGIGLAAVGTHAGARSVFDLTPPSDTPKAPTPVPPAGRADGA